MRNSIGILLLVFIPCIVSAQESVLMGSSKTLVVSASVGVSVPVGKYQNNDRLDTASGYAKPGVNYNLAFSWKFIDNFGIAWVIGGMAHTLDNTSADKYFYSSTSPIIWNSLEKYYAFRYYMGGLYFNDWASDETRFSLNARILYGRIDVDMPELGVSGKNDKGNIALAMKSASLTTHGFLVGLGGRIILTTNVALMLNMDYIISTSDFGNRDITITENGRSSTETVNFKLPTNVINYSLGLGFMF